MPRTSASFNYLYCSPQNSENTPSNLNVEPNHQGIDHLSSQVGINCIKQYSPSNLDSIESIENKDLNNLSKNELIQNTYAIKKYNDNECLTPLMTLSLDEQELVYKQQKMFLLELDENGNVKKIKGWSQHRHVIDNCYSNEKYLHIYNPDKDKEPKKIEKSPEFSELSGSEKQLLSTTFRVYIIYQREIHKKNTKNKEHSENENVIENHISNPVQKHHTKLNNHQKNKEFFQLTIGFKDRNLLTRAETLHKQEKTHQIENLKKERLKEKHDKKKLEKQIFEHEYEILNEILKSTVSSEMLRKDINKVAELIRQIKNKFPPPYLSKTVLKAG